jgi:hypothetical protein
VGHLIPHKEIGQEIRRDNMIRTIDLKEFIRNIQKDIMQSTQRNEYFNEIIARLKELDELKGMMEAVTSGFKTHERFCAVQTRLSAW